MELLKKQKFTQKIIILLVLVLTINFTIPNYSNAGVDTVLIDPIITFICWLGDGTLGFLQRTLMGEDVVIQDYADYRQTINDDNLSGNPLTWFAYGFGQMDWFAKLQGGIDKLINGDDGYEGPVVLVKYSVAAIVSNNIPAFDINFFSPDVQSTEEENADIESTAVILQPIIQKWYVALRNVAIVALLSILVYIGIKIMLSSTANEKAKYKNKIINWVVALCILFSLHYIMSATLYIIDLICNSISANVLDGEYDQLIYAIRYGTEMSGSTMENLAYTIMYATIVIYTLFFTFTYLKRTIYIAFLTMFAPLIAVTYPIDKENDGKAQAFDFWIKEYFFNILMQPIHLILYNIFIVMAIDLVNTNVIYALVAIGFILPAEKIIRKMFNVEKNSEDSSLGGFAGGALVASAVSSISRIMSGGHNRNAGGGDNSLDDGNQDNNIRTTDIEESFGNDSLDESDPTPMPRFNINDNSETNSNPPTSNGSNNGGSRNPVNINNARRANYMGARKLNLPNNSGKNSIKTNKRNAKNTNKPRVLKGIAAVGKKTFTGKNIAKVARGVGKIGLGATGLMIGAAGGIASGDFGKAITYGATGAAVGVGAVNAIDGGVKGIARGGKNIKKAATDLYDEYQIGANNYTQKEYEQNILLPRMKIQAEKNKDIKELYRRTFGNTDLLNSSARDELYRNGITDENLIIEALKAKQKHNLSNKELVQDTLIANKINSAKDAETREKQLKRILEDNGAFRNVEKNLEKRDAFKNIDKKLQDKYKEIDKDKKMSSEEKKQAKQNLAQQERERIIDKEKNRLVSGRMRVIRKISGID